MRSYVYSVLLVLSVMLGFACTAVSPDECWPNSSAGFGGEGPIPIGNGVGATTGDYGAAPSPGPQGTGDKPNPCETLPQGGLIFVKYKPSEFPFVTTMEDDPKAKAGGWQEASVNLEFQRIVLPYTIITWWCPFKIGMPLRTEEMGVISVKKAQNMSVKVTEETARTMEFGLNENLFCKTYVKRVKATFGVNYPGLGARANQ